MTHWREVDPSAQPGASADLLPRCPGSLRHLLTLVRLEEWEKRFCWESAAKAASSAELLRNLHTGKKMREARGAGRGTRNPGTAVRGPRVVWGLGLRELQSPGVEACRGYKAEEVFICRLFDLERASFSCAPEHSYFLPLPPREVPQVGDL